MARFCPANNVLDGDLSIQKPNKEEPTLLDNNFS